MRPALSRFASFCIGVEIALFVTGVDTLVGVCCAVVLAATSPLKQ